MSNMTDTLGDVNQATDNFFRPATDFASSLPGKFSDLMGTQYGQLKDLWGRYSGAIAGQQTVPSMFKQFANESGLIPKMEASNTLSNTVANMPYTWSGASRGFDVNSNQLSRIIGQKTYELTPAMTSANNAVSTALNDYINPLMTATQTQQQKELLPYQMEGSMLGEFQARQATGFTQANQQELDALLAKAQAGMALTNSERQRANDLSMLEKQYQMQLSNWKAKVGYTGQVGLAALLGLTGGA